MESKFNNKNIDRVMALTQVVKYPKSKIYTFGDTRFTYKVISSRSSGSILRSGKLTCKTPTIVTPETMQETFNGFSDQAVEFALKQYENILSRVKILGYQFNHVLETETQYSENGRILADRIHNETMNDNDMAILMSPEDIWGVSIVKVILDVVKKSAHGNAVDMAERGYFLSEQERRINEIEILFAEAVDDKQYIDELAVRLREYNLFEIYEDRFFEFFKK